MIQDMRTTLLASLTLCLFALPTHGQENTLQTTPATIMVGGSMLVTPGAARSGYVAGSDFAARGRLGGEEAIVPTMLFGFERRWGPGADLYAMDVRLGGRWSPSSSSWSAGLEGGARLHRETGISHIDGSDWQPTVSTYLGYDIGRVRIGPSVTATLAPEQTAAISFRIGYVLQ